ncbi:hypothetical protein BCEP27_100160 [Burkholderia cepacia]
MRSMRCSAACRRVYRAGGRNHGYNERSPAPDGAPAFVVIPYADYATEARPRVRGARISA